MKVMSRVCPGADEDDPHPAHEDGGVCNDCCALGARLCRICGTVTSRNDQLDGMCSSCARQPATYEDWLDAARFVADIGPAMSIESPIVRADGGGGPWTHGRSWTGLAADRLSGRD